MAKKVPGGYCQISGVVPVKFRDVISAMAQAYNITFNEGLISALAEFVAKNEASISELENQKKILQKKFPMQTSLDFGGGEGEGVIEGGESRQ